MHRCSVKLHANSDDQAFLQGKGRAWGQPTEFGLGPRLARMSRQMAVACNSCTVERGRADRPAGQCDAAAQCRINHVADVANATGLRPQGGPVFV